MREEVTVVNKKRRPLGADVALVLAVLMIGNAIMALVLCQRQLFEVAVMPSIVATVSFVVLVAGSGTIGQR